MNKYILAVLLLIAPSMSFAAACPSGTLYVDFLDGDDAKSGLSADNAWKHAPGDANATGSANCTVSGGNTVAFKGGVKYRGKVTINGQGTAADNLVIFKGDVEGFGTGKAIITGADIIDQTWTQCASADNCWGNANYANIYHTPVPLDNDAPNRLILDNVVVNISQSPSPADPLFMWITSEWHSIPNAQMTITTVEDSTFFTQADSNYWVGAYNIGWYYGNASRMRKITAFNPATDTITHDSAGGSVYTDRDEAYTIVNHPAIIDAPGEYAYRTSENRLYLWAYDNTDPADHEVEVMVRTDGFVGASKSWVTVDGFKITGMTDSITTDLQGDGVQFRAEGGTTTGITVNNCELYGLSGWNEPDAIHVTASTDGVVTITNNNIHDIFKNRGIYIGFAGAGSLVDNNVINRGGHTGMWNNCGRDYTVSRNTITDIKGVHGNGMSIYGTAARISSGITVNANKFRIGATIITQEYGNGQLFTNNVIDGDGTGYVADWQAMTGTNTWYNNTIVNGPYTGGILRANIAAATWIARNNIVAGMSANWDTHDNNILLNDVHPTLSAGEVQNGDNTAIFTDYANADYSLKTGSPAIDNGYALPSAVDNDYLGTARPQGVTWDIGAYEFGAGAPADATAPTVPSNVTATATGYTTGTVSWDASSDAVGVVGYLLYADGVLVKAQAETTYSATVAVGSSTSYTVAAYDAAGNVSAVSDAAAMTTFDYPVARPAILQGTWQ